MDIDFPYSLKLNEAIVYIMCMLIGIVIINIILIGFNINTQVHPM